MFRRLFLLFMMVILGVAALLTVIVIAIIDRPLYLRNSSSRIELLEKELKVGQYAEENSEGSGDSSGEGKSSFCLFNCDKKETKQEATKKSGCIFGCK